MVRTWSHRIVRATMMVGLSGVVLAGWLVAAAAGPAKDGQILRGTPISTSPLPDPAECVVAARTPGDVRALAPGGDRRGYGPRATTASSGS